VLDVQVAITGAAGQGIQTVGDIVSQTILSSGYPVITTKEYESRIRGGNSSYRIRIGQEPPTALREQIDVLLALNEGAKTYYSSLLGPEGAIIELPFSTIAEEIGGSKLYANSVAAGALVATLGIELSLLENVLTGMFSGKGQEVVRGNLATSKAGYSAVSALYSLSSRDFEYFLVSVNDVITLGAAYSGCRFISAYPMSPSTGIITRFAGDEGLGVFAEQAEDEIAAINMAIGASYAGARAMTATSGGGFALMSEAISLAGMTETPIVIVLAQRPGPATGLPTRTAQEDLLFSISAGHGEFAKAVLAPADPREALEKTIRAFALADRYQCPVIILTDQYLSDSHFSYSEFDVPHLSRTKPFADPSLIQQYRRYLFTEDGISPRLYPGQSEHLVSVDSDEHDEMGHISENLNEIRQGMVAKRMTKLRELKKEIALPQEYRVSDADTLLVSWGSTRGAVYQVVDRLRDRGKRVGAIHFTELWPLPKHGFPEGPKYITVEGNSFGQLACLLRMEYGIMIDATISRTDGLPITVDWLEGRIDA
jgi:2-oxoglutarate/2-oxoacid ferredoxin oxidoreductase subunit alpha